MLSSRLHSPVEAGFLFSSWADAPGAGDLHVKGTERGAGAAPAALGDARAKRHVVVSGMASMEGDPPMPGASGQLVVAALILSERGSATDARGSLPRLPEKVPPGEAAGIGYSVLKVPASPRRYRPMGNGALFNSYACVQRAAGGTGTGARSPACLKPRRVRLACHVPGPPRPLHHPAAKPSANRAAM